MTPYEELGMTHEELAAYGQNIVNQVTFRNEPYDHYVFIAGDNLDFAALACYAETHRQAGPIIKHYDRYKRTNGITINWRSFNVVYSIIGLHCREAQYFNPDTLLEFIKTTIHEQQHMLTRIERETGADHRFEDEPRTYSTAWTFDRIMEILQNRWGIYLIATPRWMIPRTRALNHVCNVLDAHVPSRDIYSGVMHQYMMSHTGTVQPNKEGWRAVTYWSGGEDV